jgi:hypothetical protein
MGHPLFVGAPIVKNAGDLLCPEPQSDIVGCKVSGKVWPKGQGLARDRSIFRYGKLRLSMEGFYTVQFVGVQGWGTGVAVYIGGHVLGGDSAVMFTGTYDRQGDAVTVKLHVKQIAPGLMNTMGRNEFDLDLAGTVEGDKIKIAGNIPGTEERLKATLTKQSELPGRV